jgi:hypothetical protein
MKNLFLLSLVLAAATMTLSCEKETWNDPQKVIGEGEIVTLPLHLNTFTGIVLEGVANLYITMGNEESTVLKAQQNIIDVLTWEVSAGKLTLGLKEGITLHNHEEIRFEIQAPVLNTMVHEGVGDVNFQGFLQEELHIDFRGVGNVIAYALPVEMCVVLHSGIGDCKVRANEILEVDISSIGDVYYKGNPEITFSDEGLGELINDN